MSQGRGVTIEVAFHFISVLEPSMAEVSNSVPIPSKEKASWEWFPEDKQNNSVKDASSNNRFANGEYPLDPLVEKWERYMLGYIQGFNFPMGEKDSLINNKHFILKILSNTDYMQNILVYYIVKSNV